MPGSAPGYQYEAELAALTDPGLPGLLAAQGVESGGFEDFSRHNINGLDRIRRGVFLGSIGPGKGVLQGSSP